MAMLKTWLRWMTRVLVWSGPVLVLLLTVASGFLTWTLTTQQGARWLLVTVARTLQGEVRDVRGSVLHGLNVGSLTLFLPEASVHMRGTQLDVNWRALWERRLHVRNLSAQTLALTANTAVVPTSSSDPIDWTALPITVVLDRLALARVDVRIDGAVLGMDTVVAAAGIAGGSGHLQLHTLTLGRVDMRRDGVALPLRLDAVALAADITADTGAVRLHQLALAHALGDVALQGDVAWQRNPQAEGWGVNTADLDVRLLDGTHWNDQPLSGMLHLQARHAPMQSASRTWPDWTQTWTLPKLALDVALGENRVVLDGAFGHDTDRLTLDVQIPMLAEFWPPWVGSLRVQGQMHGGLSQHQATLQAVFTPADEQLSVNEAILHAPVQVTLAFTGRWEDRSPPQSVAAWQAQITQLRLAHADLQVETRTPLQLIWQPQASDWVWTIGATPVRLSLQENVLFTVDHQQSRFGAGGWETRGGIARLHITDARLAQLRQTLARLCQTCAWQDSPFAPRGMRHDTAPIGNDLTVSTDWQLRFSDALEGQWHLRRDAGDFVIPWDPPVPMELRDLTLRVTAMRTAAGSSQIRGTATIHTEAMGAFAVQAQTQLRGDWQLESPGASEIAVQSDQVDLGWLNLYSTLPVELGGAVTVQFKAQHHADGRWRTQGRVAGQGIRMVYPDEGVRLLDGTLAARFDGERFVLDSLQFPARLRVEPKERRTREWIKTHPDAQDGSLTIRGDWHLWDQAGGIVMALHRYPLLQRADRYAMFSGAVRVDARQEASAFSMTGDLIADAGWADLDIVSSVPILDSDVVVHRAGDAARVQPASSMDVSLDITIDLGGRFYLTGYGVDSALEGLLRLRTQDGWLRADGALNTRSGTVTAYGQQLRLLRGSLVFQGDATSPVLDIVAVRVGDLAVQAGVRVAGTARRPRIDLISTPEVNDVEKLSWLLLGRGPDHAGGDAALLLSVGSSFFTAGEPFYRQFGLDELSMRSGALGATGSLLPVESVVRSLDAEVSDIARQFIVASKNISQDFTLSVEQALSNTGTVGRISYRLARGLNASLSLGTVNGLALVYRWFSRDNP